jgi:hypothetical protein
LPHATRSKDLGNGFIDHGVATPISNHRGIVATVDGDGKNVALVWLFDHTGCYAILVIDALTGKSQEVAVPYRGGDCPFSSVLSSRNRFYSHFNSHFVEFDPAKRAFTANHETRPQMAMGMTEDDRGRIWSVTYPNSGVVCFDPADGSIRDYGHVHMENWPQYQRSVAADDTGWIYFAVGNTTSQIISFDPQTGKATPILPENERAAATSAVVYRDINGKVYGRPAANKDDAWYELYAGKAKRIGTHENQNRKPIITDSQGLFHAQFPDGTKLVKCDTIEKIIEIEKNGHVTRNPFSYTSDGAHLMGVAAAPDGTICGGTAFPMRFFSYDPTADKWSNRETVNQCNTVARQGDRFFIGGYIYGFLLEWDPAKPYGKTEKNDPTCNPRYLTDCDPTIYRPHKLLAHPDGKTLILAGTPGYGYTGGGLLFWDRQIQKRTLLEHTAILPDHSTMSMVALPDGKLLAGSTTDAGTGGERKAKQAEMYVMDMKTHAIEWHAPVLGVSGHEKDSRDGVQSYHDLILARNGIVYGIADAHRFFAFDPATRKVLHEEESEPTFGWIAYQQGQRKLIATADGTIYVLFQKTIARIDQATHRLVKVVEPPVPPQAGGDFLDGRIYFGSGSHLYSVGIASA